MNVLVLSPWFPSPPFGGALTRVRETLRHLSRKHRVTLLAPVGEPVTSDQMADLRQFCEAVVAVPVSMTSTAIMSRLFRGILGGRPLVHGLHRSVELARELRELTERRAFDVIHVEHSFMAPLLDVVAPWRRPRTVLSMHNVESLRLRRELKTTGLGVRRLALLADRALFSGWEERALRGFDGILAVSEFEEGWIRRHVPKAAVALVPNGVDTKHFAPRQEPAAPRTIVFPGLMSYAPNIDAARWFCDEILPGVLERHPTARFEIVGDKPTAEVRALGRRPGVDVTGRVPDVRSRLAEAAAVVVPLRSGAGTRLKILEAMAMGRPVVSTTLGAEGLNVADRTDIMIADTPRSIIELICGLLENPELRRQLGRAGRELVERRYDWDLCFQGLDTVYDAIAAGAAARAGKAARMATS